MSRIFAVAPALMLLAAAGCVYPPAKISRSKPSAQAQALRPKPRIEAPAEPSLPASMPGEVLEVKARLTDLKGGLRVIANQDCYLYVYLVGVDSRTRLLVPNPQLPQVKLAFGRPWEYRIEEARHGTLRVIASTEPLPRRLEDPAFGGYRGVVKRLRLARLLWAEDAVSLAAAPNAS
ncbi:MAG: hypothetical protein HY549_02795 [Elusimicrobia bacterium]|nr:hypothetical protein [Elusimicrobiota bacterium]